MELLLLSNSRTENGFLVDYLGEMRDFAGGARRAAFVPFASVMRPWPELTALVRAQLAPAGIELEGFEALERAELIVVSGGNTFQLNCHYANHAIPGHHGETRDERLAEFAQANPGLPVLALPEGDWLRVSGERIELKGAREAFWFRGAEKAPVRPGILEGT